ncbi:MAG: AAA family ATPase, partial [Selenomonadaceae bacterium]|nr:AAA family ATPase [Selenomonadaceae bacterium]
MKQHYVMPVGVDDFKRVREEYYYVDKTDFIKTMIDGHSQATLITRPRRFGKTLAMSMLYYFFNLRDKEENRHLFEGCAIEKAGDRYMQMQGSKPVIFLSLKDIKERDFPGMLANFGEVMKNLYYDYRFLLDGDTLLPSEKEVYHAILSLNADKTRLQFSLKNLSDYLFRYYKKPVLILIDEYDAPIQYAWDNDYYDDAITFLRNYLSSVLKSNPCLDFAVITGVLRIAKESIFSSLNNLDVASIVSGYYLTSMGFTYEEVAKIAEDFGHADKLGELKMWYDGYSFAGQEIYNPWSVINYFYQGCRPATYWVNTSGNTILRHMLKHATPRQTKELAPLLHGGE